MHTLSKKKIIVPSAEKYLSTLRNNCILVKDDERRQIIRNILEANAKRVKGRVVIEDDLLDEVNYLVEHPVAVLGSFDKEYLKLPCEILINCMKKKQKFFPVLDSKDGLTNSFIGIRNGISENQGIVREGYERVLSARLADAQFFYRQDTKSNLSFKVEKLKGVVFHKKLGTVYDKVERVKKIAAYINNDIKSRGGEGVNEDSLEKACSLSKADLVTEMVFEYPEMQGVIGKIYADVYGEDKNVSAAVEEHYWPLTADGNLPDSKTGIILSIADKIDTLTGYFAIGLVPSGSADPYALRRLSIGLLRILKEKKAGILLKNIVDYAFVNLPQDLQKNLMAKDQVMDFLHQRLEKLLEAEYKFDEVRAVLSSGFNDIIDAEKRLEALKKIRSMPDFEPLAQAFKRTANILKQAKRNNQKIAPSVNNALFREDAEKKLYNNVKKMENEVRRLIDKKEYFNVLQSIVQLKPDVDVFFDKVMVMVEDTDLRANRLALLSYITKLFFSILDFSMLQG
jgi:glycyl-tRNA synthetase beta chain